MSQAVSVKVLLTPLLLALSSLAVPAHAESSAASSVSDSVSTSIGSISTSIGKSSDSSSSKKNNVAAGDYRIIDVAQAPAATQPGMVRLHLQALADATEAGELYVTLPRVAFERSQLTPGGVVAAQPRVYGVEFAVAQTHQPFFLAVHDEWAHDFQPRAVTL